MRTLFKLLVLSLLPLGVTASDSGTNAILQRLRIGPFYERRVMSDGSRFVALRPFYSYQADTKGDEEITDALWPLSTFHWNGERSWWRVLIAFGADRDIRDPESSWNLTLFPIWTQGRSRAQEDYWAFVPFYGHIPHLLLMDKIRFVLFPFYLSYAVNDVDRTYYLWPIVSRVSGTQEGQTRSTGVFPFYGHKDSAKEENDYAFWPFWTSTVYKDVNPGRSWMAFPLAARVDREHEQQWLAAPPFLSYTKTDSTERWRLPWPFFQFEESVQQKTRAWWPLYGDQVREDGLRWWAAWPIVSYETSVRRGQKVERARMFPFYVNETITSIDPHGQEQERENYLRVWPLFTRIRTPIFSHFRTLEFNPIRHADGVERNWAPFWTFYERSELGNEVEHDLLWGIFQDRRVPHQDKDVQP